MRLASIAIGIMLLVAVGLYLGLAGFQQYAVESSRSLAGQAVCAPQRPDAVTGRPVVFSVTGLPDGTLVHWSSDEGRSEVAPGGTFSVTFATAGMKSVSAFALLGDTWTRITCDVTVR